MAQSAIQVLAPRLSEQFTWDARLVRRLNSNQPERATDLFAQVGDSLYEWTAERSALALAPLLTVVEEVEAEERREYLIANVHRKIK